ncbi:MAG: lipoate--protein ligase family protein, partial [Cyanobium sp.]
GGRAVLHAGDITYALVWPEAPAERKRAYSLASGWLLNAFKAIGMPLQPGLQAASIQRSSCFATSTAADLVHPCGAKRVGSAQLWRRGCLLQHGSILVDPPTKLWRQVFGSEPPQLPRLPLGLGEMEALLIDSALASLPPAKTSGSVIQPLAPDELAAVTARSGDYGVTLTGVSPLASPDASIERTTWGRARPRG